MKQPQVFMIILNWNNGADTIECLQSFLNVDYENKKIIVVDNGSTDGSSAMIGEWLHKNFPEDSAQLISLDANLGFAGGNNVGIKKALAAEAQYVLLLNNDTIVTRDFVSRMVETAEKHEGCGIVGGKIYHYPQSEEIWFSGGYIDFFRGAGYHLRNDCHGERDSDFITGCLMLIPVRVLKDVGLFEEKYFLTFEDSDISYRIKDAGYKLIINCDAIIYHKVSVALGGRFSLRNQYYFHRNRFIFFSGRLAGFPKLLFFLFQLTLAIPLWVLVMLCKGQWNAARSACKGYYDYFRGYTGKSRYY